MQDQRQLPNVGNLGDVVKHVSLCALLKAVEALEGDLLYVETNAFRPTARIGKDGREAWERYLQGFPNTEAVRLYRSIQNFHVAQGNYLCSTAIAGQILRRQKERESDFLLCEESEESLELLRSEFSDATILESNALLSEKASSWHRK